MMYKFLSIICVSTIPYLFSISGEFVFDDSEAIVKNKNVYSGFWQDSFLNDFWGTNIKSNLSHKSYRPLTILTFRLNYLLGGEQLIAYHFKITNLVCHVFCCVLVWRIYCKLLKTNAKQKWWLDVPYLSSLLFSVHPIHVESVSGIVGRADILAGITFVLSVLAYDNAMCGIKLRLIYLILTILFSGMSMLFKENGVTALGLCIVYECVAKFTIKKDDQTKKVSLKIGADSIVRISLIAIAILLLLYGRWAVMDGTRPEFKPTDNPAAFANETFTQITTYNYIYFLNILLLIWPQWLCYDWAMGCVPLIGSINDYRIIFVGLIYLYGILILRTLVDSKNSEETRRNIKITIALIVIPFLPAANIFYPVGFVIAERVLYISSIGYCLLIGIGLGKIIQRKTYSKEKWKQATIQSKET